VLSISVVVADDQGQLEKALQAGRVVNLRATPPSVETLQRSPLAANTMVSP